MEDATSHQPSENPTSVRSHSTGRTVTGHPMTDSQHQPETHIGAPVSVPTDLSSITQLTAMRDKWLKDQLVENEVEFIDLERHRVYTVTFNVNNKKPPHRDALMELFNWAPDTQPAIVAIGLQEVDLTTTGLLAGRTARGDAWGNMLTAAIGAKGPYKLVTALQMVGVYLAVFCRADLVAHVSNIRSDTAGVGLMGMMGNKGAVAIALDLWETPLLFVCAHLAASKSKVARRNQDALDILARIGHAPNWGIFTAPPPPLPSTATQLLDAFVYTFFLGDLNYRLELDPAECLELIGARRTLELTAADQLLKQTAMNCILKREFAEGEVAFLPTYKFVPGTPDYTGIDAEKVRTASYCDRILYRVNRRLFVSFEGHLDSSSSRPLLNESFREYGLRQYVYTSINHEGLWFSDHRPVYSIISVVMKQENKEKRARIYSQMMQHLARLENECIPSIELETVNVDFENVLFGVPQTRTVSVRNVGAVAAQFQFIPKPGSHLAIPTWLSVSPSIGILLPGQTIQLTFTVNVSDPILAAELNRTGMATECLIVRLMQGKDYFMPISLSWRSSCLGVGVAELCAPSWYTKRLSSMDQQRLTSLDPEAVLSPPSLARKMMDPLAAAAHASQVKSAAEQMASLRIPREIWLTVNRLLPHLATPELFTDIAAVDGLPNYLDNLYEDDPVEGCTVEPAVLAEFLLRALSSFSDWVIVSNSLLENFHAIENRLEAETLLITLFEESDSIFGKNLFAYVTAFVRELLVTQRNSSEEEYFEEYKRQIVFAFGNAIFKQEASTADASGFEFEQLEGSPDFSHSAFRVFSYFCQ